MKWLIWNIPCLVCVSIAGYLAASGEPGWGWFLLVGALGGVAPKRVA